MEKVGPQVILQWGRQVLLVLTRVLTTARTQGRVERLPHSALSPGRGGGRQLRGSIPIYTSHPWGLRKSAIPAELRPVSVFSQRDAGGLLKLFAS